MKKMLSILCIFGAMQAYSYDAIFFRKIEKSNSSNVIVINLETNNFKVKTSKSVFSGKDEHLDILKNISISCMFKVLADRARVGIFSLENRIYGVNLEIDIIKTSNFKFLLDAYLGTYAPNKSDMIFSHLMSIYQNPKNHDILGKVAWAVHFGDQNIGAVMLMSYDIFNVGKLEDISKMFHAPSSYAGAHVGFGIYLSNF
ncbi:MAG: hypothetical protein KAH32_06260 [Chlamydiia bacterium]|nr:hypothetical protein [Chlamydiia bacterium]